jgi:hypothetical protein
MQIDQLKRRDFITLLAGAAVWPVAARAQQPAKLHRIFWASTESQPDPFVDGFREGLRERGYIEGVNVVLGLRYAPGNPDALREVIAELTRRNWDLAVSSGPAIRAMKAATEGRLVILLRELARFYAQQLVEKNHYHQSSIAPPSPPLRLSICR